MKKESLDIALVGNPNTGKTTLFNALTGLKQKVGNYPGITVERKTGSLKLDGQTHTVIDLPGTYSLNYKQLDEKIAYETLTGQSDFEDRPDLVVVVLDSTNLDRNLFLATQVMDLQLPMIVLLNMSDLAEKKGLQINPDKISAKLGVPVVPIVAKKRKEVKKVKQAIQEHDLQAPEPMRWASKQSLNSAVDKITEKWLKQHTDIPEYSHRIEALRLISNDQAVDKLVHPKKETARKVVAEAMKRMEREGQNPMAAEVMQRYDFIETCTQNGQQEVQKDEEVQSLSDKIDSVVTHKVFGPIIFVAILLLMFQAIFTWAEPFMGFIEWMFIEVGNFVAHALPPGILNDLLVEGVIAGLAGVIVFLPQIMFLFFFISILEATGYMARAAFVMDGFMTRIGLHGRSVVPLMSGFACAIPGIMATRSIENRKDRLITIMVVPFMACSARLPVYALMISAFIPDIEFLGFLGLQGITFFGLYIFGIVMAIGAAWVMKKIFTGGKPTPFLMELPEYKMPKWSTVFHNMFERGWLFVKEAGKIIVAISIVLWFLASYPKVEVPQQSVDNPQTSEQMAQKVPSNETYQLKHSYAGQFGRFVEPAIEPLGFDWKIGIGLITSFAAREVMVGTLNTIYSVGSSGSNVVTLEQKLVNAKDPQTGEPAYTTLTAISLLIFFALAMQCMSTLAIVRRETNSWKWPLIMLTYMTSLAYISSFIVYQVGMALGWG